MKKKIKLNAYELNGRVEHYLETHRPSGVCWAPRPEFDIETEIDTPDEPKKPREFWVIELNDEYEFHSSKPLIDANSEKLFKVCEVLPGRIEVSEEKLRSDYFNGDGDEDGWKHYLKYLEASGSGE